MTVKELKDLLGPLADDAIVMVFNDRVSSGVVEVSAVEPDYDVEYNQHGERRVVRRAVTGVLIA